MSGKKVLIVSSNGLFREGLKHIWASTIDLAQTDQASSLQEGYLFIYQLGVKEPFRRKLHVNQTRIFKVSRSGGGRVGRIKATFDKPGRYVWHCHILSHEDHEMMRVLHVGPGV